MDFHSIFCFLRGIFGRFFEKKLRKKLIKKGNFIYQYQ